MIIVVANAPTPSNSQHQNQPLITKQATQQATQQTTRCFQQAFTSRYLPRLPLGGA